MALVVASCTSDDSGTVATTAVPEPTTAAPPATTTTTTTTTVPPTTTTTTTTTLPPGLQPQVLSSGLTANTLATYEAGHEVRVGWQGEAGAMFVAGSDGDEGLFTTSISGRRRLLALDAIGGLEIVGDFIAESGTVVTAIDDDRTELDLERADLADLDPAAPPVVVDASLGFVTSGRAGAPDAYGTLTHLFNVAAVVGPPFDDAPVDVGDSWTVSRRDDVLGSLSVASRIIAEHEPEPDRYVFEIEFAGETSDLPVTVPVATAAGVLGADLGREGLLAETLPEGVSSQVEIRAASVDGSLEFDPLLGVALSYESLQTYTVDFFFEEDGGVAFTIDLAVFRSGTLSDIGEGAPFERDRVLDRFESDPNELAGDLIFDLPGYLFDGLTDEEVDLVFGPLDLVRSDLLAGAAAARMVDESGESAIAIALTNGGDLRGAPFVAEELMSFLSESRTRTFTAGSATAYRGSVADSPWHAYNNETHTFVVIGPTDVSTRILTDIVEAAEPYLWQEGDCFDFEDGFGGATPYAPFGLYGSRHCMVDHTYEVIHSEVLPEGPDAPFPSDISVRSDMACAEAFFEFTGTTELVSALGLIRYLPDEEEWEKGSRYLACVVYLTGPEGDEQVSGRIDGTDPSLLFELEVGTCLFDLFPVDCDDPHNGEIYLVRELPDRPGDPRPEDDVLDRRLIDACNGTFGAFELRIEDGPGRVDFFAFSDAAVAWELGVRTYYCVASAFDATGFRLEITGTFEGGWEEAGERVTA